MPNNSDSPLKQTLEDALVNDPDNLATHAAYADLLMEQNDPRGEFIQVQLALEDPNRSAEERKGLQKRERELLRRNRHKWFGRLYPYFHAPKADVIAEASFRRGWLDSVSTFALHVDFARALGQNPLTRLLRRLLIANIDEVDPNRQHPAPDLPDAPGGRPGLFPLACSTFLKNVREFELGPAQGEPLPEMRTLIPLLGQMPRLEKLRLNVELGTYQTEALGRLDTLVHLRSLESLGSDHFDLEYLADNAVLRRLAHLCIRLRPASRQAINHEGIVAVLRSPNLKRLRSLRLVRCEGGDDLCRAIVRSRVLRRLKVLEISRSGITDRGASLLARCPDLANLELLDMSENHLTEAGLQVLEDAGVTEVIALGQGAVDEGDFYDEIQE